MPKRKKGARVDTPVEGLGEKETMAHYNAVLIEELDSKFQLVIEAVKSSHDSLSRRISDLEERFERRFETLELAVKGNSDRITKLELAVRGNSDRISTLENVTRGLKDDMIDMERRICSMINRMAERCTSHGCRLTALEAR